MPDNVDFTEVPHLQDILSFLPINPDDEEDIVNYIQNITNLIAVNYKYSFKLSTNELLICNEMSVSSLITEHRGYGTKLKEFKKVLADYCQEMGYI